MSSQQKDLLRLQSLVDVVQSQCPDLLLPIRAAFTHTKGRGGQSTQNLPPAQAGENIWITFSSGKLVSGGAISIVLAFFSQR